MLLEEVRSKSLVPCPYVYVMYYTGRLIEYVFLSGVKLNQTNQARQMSSADGSYGRPHRFHDGLLGSARHHRIPLIQSGISKNYLSHSQLGFRNCFVVHLSVGRHVRYADSVMRPHVGYNMQHTMGF